MKSLELLGFKRNGALGCGSYGACFHVFAMKKAEFMKVGAKQPRCSGKAGMQAACILTATRKRPWHLMT